MSLVVNVMSLQGLFEPTPLMAAHRASSRWIGLDESMMRSMSANVSVTSRSSQRANQAASGRNFQLPLLVGASMPYSPASAALVYRAHGRDGAPHVDHRPAERSGAM